MTRRELREQVFKVLFGADFYDTADFTIQIQAYQDAQQEWDVKDGAYITEKCKNIAGRLSDLDAAINEAAKGWKTNRMGKVELTLLRLAVYEMRYEEDIPVKVAINEAVELAKKYGSEDSPSFVNGVLGKLA